MFGRRISPRRARAMHEAERLATQLAALRRDNARREREFNGPCPLCVALVATRPAITEKVG